MKMATPTKMTSILYPLANSPLTQWLTELFPLIYSDRKMSESVRIADRHGKTWTVAKVRRDEAEAEDFRFWYEGLTPEERVEAVSEALKSCLKTRGLDAVPRLRRVHRRVKCPWAAFGNCRPR